MEKIKNGTDVIQLRDHNNNDYYKRKYILLIIVGIALGFCISQLYKFKSNNYQIDITNNNDLVDYNFAEDIHDTDDMAIANKLKDEVKVLCWIMTHPNNHKERAKYIRKTWGKRCNKLLVISSIEDIHFNIISLPGAEGTSKIWKKTIEAYKFLYKNYINKYDWFLRADDDTYVIVENLRYLLYGYDPRSPIFFGHKYDNEDYMVSGAGYVISKETLRRFIDNALPYPEKCNSENTRNADVEFGKCLKSVGVIAGNSHDSHNRSRFNGRRPQDIKSGKPDPQFGYWSKMYYETFTNKNCCSDYAISFHGVMGNQMRVLDYLIYNLRPYGIERIPEPLPEKKIYIENDIENDIEYDIMK